MEQKPHTGSKSIADFFGWDSGKWRTRPIRIYRNIAALAILILALGLLATAFMTCQNHPIFC